MKTRLLKPKEVTHEWFIVDVSGKVLGRVATRIATLLKGKYQADFTPHVDSGAGVVVINCDKVRVTGEKEKQKFYKTFSGYPRGQKEIAYEKMFEKDPTYVMRHAVRGMLPKNKLGVLMLKRLKPYIGSEHPHAAQKPKEYKI